MATHHAAPGELIDLKNWSNDLGEAKTKVITKTKGLELARLVIGAGVDMHHSKFCSVKGVSVFHCISGDVILKTRDDQISLKEGQLAYLEADTEHALLGVKMSVVLLTIVL